MVDLKRRETITNRWIASRAGWTPYDGVTVTGWPVGTFVRGRRVMWEGNLSAPAGAKRCGSWKPWRLPRAAELLPREVEREFSVANPPAEPLGKACGGFFAVSRNQLGKCREQAGLRQAIAVDPLDARVRPSLVQVAERNALLLMFRSRPRSLDRVHGDADAKLVAASPAAVPGYVSTRARSA